jgi:hypothetical protein
MRIVCMFSERAEYLISKSPLWVRAITVNYSSKSMSCSVRALFVDIFSLRLRRNKKSRTLPRSPCMNCEIVVGDQTCFIKEDDFRETLYSKPRSRNDNEDDATINLIYAVYY